MAAVGESVDARSVYAQGAGLYGTAVKRVSEFIGRVIDQSVVGRER